MKKEKELNKEIIEELINEFEEEIKIDGNLRYSTQVEPRLCNAEKTKEWIKEKLEQVLIQQKQEIKRDLHPRGYIKPIRKI